MNNIHVKCKSTYSLPGDIQLIFDFNTVKINSWCLEIELFCNNGPFYIVRDCLLKWLNIPLVPVPNYGLLGLILKKWKLARSEDTQVIKIKRDAGIKNSDLYSIGVVFPVGQVTIFGLLDDVLKLQNICEELYVSKKYHNINMTALSFNAYEQLGSSHVDDQDLEGLSPGDAILIDEFFELSKVEIF